MKSVKFIVNQLTCSIQSCWCADTCDQTLAQSCLLALGRCVESTAETPDQNSAIRTSPTQNHTFHQREFCLKCIRIQMSNRQMSSSIPITYHNSNFRPPCRRSHRPNHKFDYLEYTRELDSRCTWAVMDYIDRRTASHRNSFAIADYRCWHGLDFHRSDRSERFRIKCGNHWKSLRAEGEKEIQVEEIKLNHCNVLPINVEGMITPLPQIITQDFRRHPRITSSW